MALGFGLVHGMGYANYIRMMLSKNQDLLWSLFSFNVGLEMGQILVVLLVLSLQWGLEKYKVIHATLLTRIVSSLILIVSLLLVIERYQALDL
jgi:uncharacterized membrane protein YedE/YeeE